MFSEESMNVRYSVAQISFNSCVLFQYNYRWFLLPTEAKDMLSLRRRFGPPCPDRLNIRRFSKAKKKEEVLF